MNKDFILKHKLQILGAGNEIFAKLIKDATESGITVEVLDEIKDELDFMISIVDSMKETAVEIEEKYQENRIFK